LLLCRASLVLTSAIQDGMNQSMSLASSKASVAPKKAPDSADRNPGLKAQPTQEAINALVERLTFEKQRLMHENQMLSLESEIARLSVENTALRASVHSAYSTPMGCMPFPAMQTPVMMPVEPLLGNSMAMINPQTAPALLQQPFVVPGPVSAGQESQELKPTVEEADAASGGGETRTTVMLRNLPNNYTRDMLLELIDSRGFKGQYDFLYLPIDFQTYACLGYAFVNLISPAASQRFWREFDGFRSWSLPSKKVCYVSWSGPHQGLEAHVERYRNSPVMHQDVLDEFKPVLFKDGVRVLFPLPSKSIRPPRVRKTSRHQQPS